MCVCVFAWVYVYHVCIGQWRPEEDVRSTGTGVKGSSKLLWDICLPSIGLDGKCNELWVFLL